MKNVKCECRIDDAMKDRLADLARLLGGEQDKQVGRIEDYALCFDYVAPYTFDDQPEEYLRYQISWGGPSDEFRFYICADRFCRRIEYWFLDWFDGAHRDCTRDATAMKLWCWLCDSGAVDRALGEAE